MERDPRAYLWDVQQAAKIDHARVWQVAETLLPSLHEAVSVLLAELGTPDTVKPERLLKHYERIAIAPGTTPAAAILAKRNTPFYASEISALRRGPGRAQISCR